MTWLFCLSLGLVAVRLVLGQELEVFIRRTEEHLTVQELATNGGIEEMERALTLS